MNTLLLDISAWDLVVDSAGNIAMASDPYSLAQDAASACRTFEGECWYNTLIGVPLWAKILGQFPPLALVKAAFTNAALTVPGVVAAATYISSFVNRELKGQVQVTNEQGIITAVNLS